MQIVISPDPILREVCKPIDDIDNSIKRLAKQMAKEMYKNDGCGIAAPQLGVTKRLVVIDTEYDGKKMRKKNPLVLVNPQLISHSQDTWTGDEGCLSVPGISCPIDRYVKVCVNYTDLDGQEHTVEAEKDLLCRCLQHEIDHLEGMTMFERLDPMLRIDALKAYRQALEAGAGPASERASIKQD